MNVELLILFLGLFPGLLFSKLYLREVPDATSTVELKFISTHTIISVIFGTAFLIFCIILAKSCNWLVGVSHHYHPTTFSGILLPFLILYLISFYMAFRLGNLFCTKRVLYSYFTAKGRWDAIFSRVDKRNYFVTTVVETGGDTWLYIGILDNYVTKNGELEIIQLRRPYRRAIKGDEVKKESLKAFYRIDVDILSIQYKDIRSLGVRTIAIE